MAAIQHSACAPAHGINPRPRISPYNHIADSAFAIREGCQFLPLLLRSARFVPAFMPVFPTNKPEGGAR